MNPNKTIVSAIANIVRERYVFPDVANRLAVLLEEGISVGSYEDAAPEILASRLTAELRRSSGDAHLRVTYSPEAHVPEPSGATIREQNDRAEHCRQMNYGLTGIERHAGDIAVLAIKELVEPELSRPTFESALDAAAAAKGLVIDLRNCVGGDPSTVALVCSHLFDKRTELSRIVPRSAPVEEFWADPDAYPNRFGGKKPVYLIVAKFTFSGAEMLAYDLQAHRRAIVVGATTGGGAHGCMFHWPSPHFSLLLPEAAPVNPVTSRNWEGCGVIPDVQCEETQALELALELARRSAEDAGPL